MDSALQSKGHVDEIQRMVTKAISNICSLRSSTWGLSLQDMRDIYRGVELLEDAFLRSIEEFVESEYISIAVNDSIEQLLQI